MPHRYIYKRVLLWCRRGQRFVKYRILHVDDTPHRIALGVAIGLFVTWTPTIGFQMALTVLLCAIFRANKLVGVPFVWISNPLTIIPIYYWTGYCIGVRFFRGAEAATLTDWWAMVGEVFYSGLPLWSRIAGFWKFALNIAGPLWLGSVLCGVVIGTATYWATYVAVVRYRRRFGRGRLLAAPRAAAGDSPGTHPSDPEA